MRLLYHTSRTLTNIVRWSFRFTLTEHNAEWAKQHCAIIKHHTEDFGCYRISNYSKKQKVINLRDISRPKEKVLKVKAGEGGLCIEIKKNPPTFNTWAELQEHMAAVVAEYLKDGKAEQIVWKSYYFTYV